MRMYRNLVKAEFDDGIRQKFQWFPIPVPVRIVNFNLSIIYNMMVNS